jgi:hypothetical protein
MVEELVPTALAPDVALMQLMFGKQITYSLAAMARLGIADHMSATPISIETLAEKVDAHGPSLYRVMRMLASVGVFTEAGRKFALTRVGDLLKSDQKNPVRYRAMPRGDEWTTRAYEHFVDCVRTGGDGVTTWPPPSYLRSGHSFQMLVGLFVGLRQTLFGRATRDMATSALGRKLPSPRLIGLVRFLAASGPKLDRDLVLISAI